MALAKITSEDLYGKGVTYLPDVNEMAASEMKAKFEEVVRAVVIPIFNANVDLLNEMAFIDPDSGNEYLTTGHEISTYEGILSNADVNKVPAAIAIKAMDTAIKALITAAESAASAGDLALSNNLAAFAGRVSTLEGKANVYDGKFQTVEADILSLKNRMTAVENYCIALDERVTALEQQEDS
jgi:hypothetical protein